MRQRGKDRRVGFRIVENISTGRAPFPQLALQEVGVGRDGGTKDFVDERGTPCGFVHVPPTPDLACGSATVPFEDLREALRGALDGI